MQSPVAVPDLSTRPLRMSVEYTLLASPSSLYKAWTEELDRWLAAPGTVLMQPLENTAFFFETHHGKERHQYYGRFLRLVPERIIEMVWLSTGTKRAETVLRIEFTPGVTGSHVLLSQTGFPDEESRNAHCEAWPFVLAELDKVYPAGAG